MRILITADLHYDIQRSRPWARRLARAVNRMQADAFVLVGDTAGADLDVMAEAMQMFAPFGGLKLLVPGNHCLWCADAEAENSLDRYFRLLPELAGECGFVLLDHCPMVLGGVGLVGSVGWYDYSFADVSLDIPIDFYKAKLTPGAASYLGGHEELLETHRHRLTPSHLSLGARWMDGVHVRLPMSDENFVAMLAERLQRQITELSGRTDRIVAFVHHLPFGELVPAGRPDRFAFAAAYMGAGRLGAVLLESPKVTHVYCGHSHWPDDRQIGHIRVVNVGSTYTKKRLKILKL